MIPWLGAGWRRPAGPGSGSWTLDQALLRLALAAPAVATVLAPARDRGHLAELAVAADLPPPTPEDLDLLAELGEERR